jgi:dipeptidyl aminopeptidase/acylaminoacyl peptidase
VRTLSFLVVLALAGPSPLHAAPVPPAGAFHPPSLQVVGPASSAPTPHAPDSLTAADYARAEGFLDASTSRLVFGDAVRPVWLDGDRFWYRTGVRGGSEYVLVDPATGIRARAFDHERLVGALARAGEPGLDPLRLPLADLAFEDGGRALTFQIRDRRFTCTLDEYACTSAPVPERLGRAYSVSPDGARAVFVREHDLWVRDIATGEERALTTDGVEDFGYATDNAGWTRSERPVVKWSPDSRKVATFQHDARGVGMMYLVSTEVGHPELEAWRYPLPEDTVVFRIARVVVDVVSGEVVRLAMPPDLHRSTVCDHVLCGGEFADVQWSPDATRLAFVSSSRDHKEAILRVADAGTGEVRTVLSERVETFFESGYGEANWRVRFDAGEVLWFSQRDDWGHLYRYDLSTGEPTGRLTEGAWNVVRVLDVDEEGGRLLALGVGREPGDPYFRYLYSVGLADGDVRLLSPDSADHTVEVSPSGAWVVDVWSTPTTPPISVVRDREGEVVLELEKADVSELLAAGWLPPEPFAVDARDGVTELHGLLFRPTGFDPSKAYPVVNYLYPGPQTGSVGSRSFSAARRDHQALAELGFVVVILDAMGTPLRSKSFHEAYYGDMGDNGLPDQVGALRQLGQRHPWMDLDRVGIWGHSGGGYAAAAGIFDYPDVYKVAVSQAGNHDNRNYEDDWGEKWQGLLERRPDGGSTYDNQANQLDAHKLEGKLLLAHGSMDSNVPPSSTLLVVNALIGANKDFDLLLLPNRGHGFANEPYMMRRRWDYFVRHLLGARPPEGYEIGRRPVS